MLSKTKLKDDLKRPRIGIDLLGCDLSGDQLLRAITETPFVEEHPPLLTFFGTEEVFANTPAKEGCIYHVVEEAISPDDDPITVLRHKKNSSLLIGIDQIKHYKIDAFITAGNTGTLLSAATLNLPRLKGIDRPALMSLIPSKLDPIAVLDIGANVQIQAETFLKFALMGIAYQKSRGVAHPTVGLLNIGEEKNKGTPVLRKAYKLLESLNDPAPLDTPIFLGNIEGRDVFQGNIDVLVTDGFTGNIFLKTAEGIAGFVLDQIQQLEKRTPLPELRSIVAGLRHHLHYAEHPGAILCGIEGIVIKCHGISTPEAFLHSIKNASRLVQHFFIQKIQQEIEK